MTSLEPLLLATVDSLTAKAMLRTLAAYINLKCGSKIFKDQLLYFLQLRINELEAHDIAYLLQFVTRNFDGNQLTGQYLINRILPKLG
jgi:hypothetical protein